MDEHLEKLKVNLRQLSEASDRLKEAINEPFDEFMRDAIIQRFEFTFELAWKTMKIALKHYKVYESTPRIIIHEAFKAKIIPEIGVWEAILEARNMTSHVYDEDEAQKIYQQILNYPPHFDALLKSFLALK